MKATARGQSAAVAVRRGLRSPPRPRARRADGGDASLLVDRREIVVPARAAELVRIDNLLGRVVVRGDRPPGRDPHRRREARGLAPEALGRLRVHYTAFESGEVVVDTRVELGGRERSLPLAGSGIDLVLEVPADVAIEAKTFGGDVSASGLRAGAKLETTGGRIGVSDVRGGVVTRQLRGGQRVAAVEGDVDLDGVEGDMDLRDVGGGRVDARLVDGSIRAEDVRSGLVRLVTTTGQIVLIGVIRPAAHYDLRSYAGDVRVVPVGRARLVRAARPLLDARSTPTSRCAARAARASGCGPNTSAGAPPPATRTALLELSSALGRVIIQPRTTPETALGFSLPMRIGMFSDTHANLEALEAVLKALDEEGVDQRVCLGDTVGYGASPNECCALIRAKTAHTILGNHDAAVAGRMDYSYYYHAARHALDLHARLLTPENMQWLKDLPYEVRKGEVHYCHGSPLNIEDFDYIFAARSGRAVPGHLGRSRGRSRSSATPTCASRSRCPPTACTRWSRTGSSCGPGGSTSSASARWASRATTIRAPATSLFDTDKRQFEFRRVEYDIKSSAEKIFSTDLEPNFGHRLFIGV